MTRFFFFYIFWWRGRGQGEREKEEKEGEFKNKFAKLKYNCILFTGSFGFNLNPHPEYNKKPELLWRIAFLFVDNLNHDKQTEYILRIVYINEFKYGM